MMRTTVRGAVEWVRTFPRLDFNLRTVRPEFPDEITSDISFFAEPYGSNLLCWFLIIASIAVVLTCTASAYYFILYGCSCNNKNLSGNVSKPRQHTQTKSAKKYMSTISKSASSVRPSSNISSSTSKRVRFADEQSGRSLVGNIPSEPSNKSKKPTSQTWRFVSVVLFLLLSAAGSVSDCASLWNLLDRSKIIETSSNFVTTMLSSLDQSIQQSSRGYTLNLLNQIDTLRSISANYSAHNNLTLATDEIETLSRVLNGSSSLIEKVSTKMRNGLPLHLTETLFAQSSRISIAMVTIALPICTSMLCSATVIFLVFKTKFYIILRHSVVVFIVLMFLMWAKVAFFSVIMFTSGDWCYDPVQVTQIMSTSGIPDTITDATINGTISMYSGVCSGSVATGSLLPPVASALFQEESSSSIEVPWRELAAKSSKLPENIYRTYGLIGVVSVMDLAASNSSYWIKNDLVNLVTNLSHYGADSTTIQLGVQTCLAMANNMDDISSSVRSNFELLSCKRVVSAWTETQNSVCDFLTFEILPSMLFSTIVGSCLFVTVILLCPIPRYLATKSPVETKSKTEMSRNSAEPIFESGQLRDNELQKYNATELEKDSGQQSNVTDESTIFDRQNQKNVVVPENVNNSTSIDLTDHTVDSEHSGVSKVVSDTSINHSESALLHDGTFNDENTLDEESDISKQSSVTIRNRNTRMLALPVSESVENAALLSPVASQSSGAIFSSENDETPVENTEFMENRTLESPPIDINPGRYDRFSHSEQYQNFLHNRSS